MGIIKSLNIKPGKAAQTGDVQVQPVKSTYDNAATNAEDDPRDTDSPGILIAADAPVSRLSALERGSGDTLRSTEPSLSEMIDGITKRPGYMIPGDSSRFSRVLPSFLSMLQLDKSESSDDLVTTTREFEPYERLTGISHERPEIVMLTNFMPIINRERTADRSRRATRLRDSGYDFRLTGVGLYVDAQINARNLRATNMIQALRDVKRCDFHVRRAISMRKSKLSNQLTTLKTSTGFLIELIRRFEDMKNQLDMRDDVFTVIPANVIRNHTINYTQSNQGWRANALSRVATRMLPPQYTMSDSLARLGYQREWVEQYFTSTKVWLQLLLEYKSILRDHSLELLDIDPVPQKNDSSATRVTRHDVPLFALSTDDQTGLPLLDDLASISAGATLQTNQMIRQSLSRIYDQVTFKSEEARMSALAVILSKELNYSRALNNSRVTRLLTEEYGYSAPDVGNLTVFDSVIGQFGENVSEFPAVTTNSLAALAQQQVNEGLAVLPFESKYLEGDSGTLTPGSRYYVDGIFTTDGRSFNTDRLKEFSQKLSKAHKNFSAISSGFNTYKTVSVDDRSRSKRRLVALMSDPAEMMKFITGILVDKEGISRPTLIDDRLTSLFTMANRRPDIRAILFTYFINRISRSYDDNAQRSGRAAFRQIDNTVTTDKLLDELGMTLTGVTRSVGSTANRFVNMADDANDLNIDVIKTSLKNGTKLTFMIEMVLSQVLEAFRQSGAFVDGRTRYGGHRDTVIMMVIFDILMAAIARYGNQDIVSKQLQGRRTTGNDKFNFVVAKTETNHRTQIQDMVNRLERESALVQKLTWSVLNMMEKLSSSMNSFVNYLNSQSTMIRLQAIADVVDNPQEFRLLMSQQQIMMLASHVEDIIGRFTTRKAYGSRNDDLDSDGDFDSDDEIKIIDDSVVTPRMRNAVYGIFGTEEFASVKAYNKRILTVGIPNGFTRRLQQKVRIAEQQKTSFASKQSDIVNVTVYKIDMLNQDIVYRPQRYLFEMSRFPVRNEALYHDVSVDSTIDDLASAIPTRDFAESIDEGSSSSVAYWHSDAAGTNTSNALDAESYSFMTQVQKAEIIRNHLMSHMLEVYLRLVTGLSVSEPHFDIDPGDLPKRFVGFDFLKTLVGHQVKSIADFTAFGKATRNITRGASGAGTSTVDDSPIGGVLFSQTVRQGLAAVASTRHSTLSRPRTSGISGVAGDIAQVTRVGATSNSPRRRAVRASTAVSADLTKLRAKQIPKAVHSLKAIVDFSRMQTSIANALSMSKEMLRPKQFDRVFNVVVDPDDFEINYDETVATPQGRQALEQLIKRGDVISPSASVTERRMMARLPIKNVAARLSGIRPIGIGSPDPSVANYKYRDRDRNAGDLMFEKYFVTIETFGEELV